MAKKRKPARRVDWKFLHSLPPKPERKLVLEPQTPEEWQTIVDVAHALLALDSARKYGLVKGGPGVAIDRAVELLDRGKLLGYLPSADSIQRLVEGLMRK